jgi:hypothetical protein
VNANLWAGVAMAVVAVIFVVWTRLRPLIMSRLGAPTDDRPACRWKSSRNRAVAVPVPARSRDPAIHHVVRNIGLIVVAGIGLATSLSGAAVDPGMAVAAAAGGAVIGGLVTRLDDLVALFA